jgi:hypothetical protein
MRKSSIQTLLRSFEKCLTGDLRMSGLDLLSRRKLLGLLATTSATALLLSNQRAWGEAASLQGLTGALSHADGAQCTSQTCSSCGGACDACGALRYALSGAVIAGLSGGVPT